MSRWVSHAFWAAGAVNIVGMLFISRGFTNDALASADPNVFSTFGQALILVWGLAYIAVARSWKMLPWLCLVFSIEKMFYVGAWATWWMGFSERFSTLLEQDLLTAAFIAGYGLNDLAFGLMFLYAFLVARRSNAPDK